MIGLKSFRDYVMEENITADKLKSMIKSAFGAKYGITDFKTKSSKTFMCLVTKGNRADLLVDIEKEFTQYGAKYDVNKGQSSVGATTVAGFTVGASPANKQGKKSAGLDNEDALIDTINMYCASGPINIVFKAGTKTFRVEGVEKAIEMGRDTSGRKKSDVNLQVKNKLIPLSLKKDGAEMWESADSYYAAKAKKIVDQQVGAGNVEMTGTTIKKITPNIAVHASNAEARDVVFGSDIIRDKGAVLYRTWKSSDFKINADGDLECETTSIYRTLQEVRKSDSDVYFLIRNDSSRRGSKIYPGIRVLAVGKSRINRKVLVV